jgi:hypothetical protein
VHANGDPWSGMQKQAQSIKLAGQRLAG